MIWYDMIWYDMKRYDMIWYDMIWYDIIQSGFKNSNVSVSTIQKHVLLQKMSFPFRVQPTTASYVFHPASCDVHPVIHDLTSAVPAVSVLQESKVRSCLCSKYGNKIMFDDPWWIFVNFNNKSLLHLRISAKVRQSILPSVPNFGGFRFRWPANGEAKLVTCD